MIITPAPSPPAPGLIETIEAAGHFVSIGPDGWHVDDAVAVQTLIASYPGSAAELQWWQAQAIGAVQGQYAKLLAAGCIISLNGTNYTMALDTADLQHYDAEALTAIGDIASVPGTPSWDVNEFWLAADNVTMVPMATAALALATATAIRTYFKALVKNAATLAQQISAAASVAAVQTISPTSGWPSNP